MPALSDSTRGDCGIMTISSACASTSLGDVYKRQDLFQPRFDALLNAFFRWMVVHAVLQVVGQALHVGHFRFQIVRILISLAVAKCFHQACRGVAQMQRHGILRRTFYVFLHLAIGGVHGVRLGSSAEIDHRLRQREVAFGDAEKIKSVTSGKRDAERVGVGQTCLLYTSRCV